MELHVKVLAVLYIVYGAFGLVMAVLMLLAFGGVTGLVGLAAVNEPEALLAVPVIGALGTLIVGFMLLMSVPRILALVLSALGLVNIPFGTVLGVYGLWVLLSRATGPLFGIEPTATGGPLRVSPPSS